MYRLPNPIDTCLSFSSPEKHPLYIYTSLTLPFTMISYYSIYLFCSFNNEINGHQIQYMCSVNCIYHLSFSFTYNVNYRISWSSRWTINELIESHRTQLHWVPPWVGITGVVCIVTVHPGHLKLTTIQYRNSRRLQFKCDAPNPNIFPDVFVMSSPTSPTGSSMSIFSPTGNNFSPSMLCTCVAENDHSSMY